MSIRARLLCSLLAGVMLAVLVGGVSLHVFTQSRLVAEFRAALLSQARTLASTVVVEHGESEVEVVAAGSPEFPLTYRIETVDGKTLAESGVIVWEGVRPSLPEPGNCVWAEVEFPGDADGLGVIYGFHPAIQSDEQGGPGDIERIGQIAWVAAARPTAGLDRSIAIVGSAITGFGVLVLVTTALLVWIGVRTGLKPLDRYVDSIKAIDPEALDWPYPPVGTPSELRPAYEALSNAIGRVGEAMERERRFTDAAAHELRTPVAELRTVLDVARRWPERDRVTRALGVAESLLASMTELIESLLMLSRSSRDIVGPPEDLERMMKIVEDETARMSERAEAAGVEVSLDGADEWKCQRLCGQIIVRNLLDNAIEYTPRGGRVDIRMGHDSLSVSNGPVALNPEQAGRLFEPFWRADDSRTNRQHHGLGLGIVRHAAEGSGLICWAELSGDTLTITISTRASGSNRDSDRES